MTNETKYISLKEAAQISGYAPDYIGQLIRQGKIPGKQVYLNVAWLTTEGAIKEYAEKNRLGKPQQFKNGAFWETRLAKVFTIAFYFFLTLAASFALVLFYIFSVSVEKKLQQQAINRAQNLESKR